MIGGSESVKRLRIYFVCRHSSLLDHTVKPVLSDHSKKDKTKISMTYGSLMQVESILDPLYPHQLKKNVIKFGPPLTKLSEISAHVWLYNCLAISSFNFIFKLILITNGMLKTPIFE